RRAVVHGCDASYRAPEKWFRARFGIFSSPQGADFLPMAVRSSAIRRFVFARARAAPGTTPELGSLIARPSPRYRKVDAGHVRRGVLRFDRAAAKALWPERYRASRRLCDELCGQR